MQHILRFLLPFPFPTLLARKTRHSCEQVLPGNPPLHTFLLFDIVSTPHILASTCPQIMSRQLQALTARKSPLIQPSTAQLGTGQTSRPFKEPFHSISPSMCVSSFFSPSLSLTHTHMYTYEQACTLKHSPTTRTHVHTCTHGCYGRKVWPSHPSTPEPTQHFLPNLCWAATCGPAPSGPPGPGSILPLS